MAEKLPHILNMETQEKKKCAHPSCNCVAREGSEYCSEYCETEGKVTKVTCNCGHMGCSLMAAGGSMPLESERVG